ncbi:hypothetical protein IA54_021855 [Xanthomonas phaseoli pv. syngonii LMG 9055]|uniref:Uncharacterized protein n=1 Tax=Xanthomonas phaseoli pv. syngonii LMG 9055 TaxID=1437878 RepID=A0A1V9HAJ7_9XANT|nr:hypothetical protein IA54_021855 [Xanthomonas phaseoli pv. syngonii LMG 9055]
MLRRRDSLSELTVFELVHHIGREVALPAREAAFAVSQSIRRVTTVDRNACCMRILPGRLRHIVLPVPGCDPRRIFRLCGQFGVRDQVEFQRFAGLAILILAGELDVAATTVKITITGLVVAHAPAIHQLGKFLRLAAQCLQARFFQRLRSFAQCGTHFRTHLRGAAGVAEPFFQAIESARFVAYLGHEIGQFGWPGDSRCIGCLQQPCLAISCHGVTPHFSAT